MVGMVVACPRCAGTIEAEVGPATRVVACGHCATTLNLAAAPTAEGDLDRCLACPSRDLFVRKDFPQRLGVAIVVLGIIASSVAWYYEQLVATYAILFGTALLDVVVYLLCGNLLECYACHAQYRRTSLDAHPEFELEVHERHRQQRARLKQATARAERAERAERSERAERAERSV